MNTEIYTSDTEAAVFVANAMSDQPSDTVASRTGSLRHFTPSQPFFANTLIVSEIKISRPTKASAEVEAAEDDPDECYHVFTMTKRPKTLPNVRGRKVKLWNGRFQYGGDEEDNS